MHDFFRFRQFIAYQYKAKTKYYLHSPFVYQFYLHVLEGKSDDALTSIASLRQQLRNNTSVIMLNDLGTGKASSTTIARLEGKVSVRPKYGQLLYRLVKYLQPANIFELGTCIGLSTSYLALAAPHTKLLTIEGSPALLATAKHNFEVLGLKNITTCSGNLDMLLPETLKDFQTLGLVFFDANHRKKATLNYFKQCLEKASAESIFIFDDIYHSPEMFAAWQTIKAHPKITLTLDVFQFGICFFKKDKLAKEDFILRY